MIVRLRPDFKIPAHKAGQYSSLGLGHWEPRHAGCQEEIAKPGEEKKSDPPGLFDQLVHPRRRRRASGWRQPGWLEFYIVLVRKTEKNPPALTPRLFMLQEGDRVLHGREDRRALHARSGQAGRHGVFLSTGTGEAPHNYMLWELLRQRPPGPDPVGLLRPLQARPRLSRRSTTS